MQVVRWLLPFTDEIDMQAIDYAIRLVKESGATLVAASLLVVPDAYSGKGARLEHIQQSKDFLEVVQWKAARYEVPVECYEVFTANALQSITALAHDQRCDRIFLVTAPDRDVLLSVHTVKHLLVEAPVSLVLLRLSARSRSRIPRLLDRLRHFWRWQAHMQPRQETLDMEET